MKIHLIRHGKTLGNTQKRYIGSTDESLCDEGVDAIKAFVQANKYCPVARLFVSPLKRCRETAVLIYPNLKAHIVLDLRENHFGDFEGLTFEEIVKQSGHELFGKNEALMIFPNGESAEEFKSRVIQAFLNIAGQNTEDTAIITHGGVVMAIMEHTFGDEFYKYNVHNGCGYTLTYGGGPVSYESI